MTPLLTPPRSQSHAAGAAAAAPAVAPRALVLLVLAACAACGHTNGARGAEAVRVGQTGEAVHAAEPAAAAARGGNDAAVADGRAPGPLALGAFEVQVPSCPADANAEQMRFCAAAARAVRAAFEDDDDDPSRLLALSNALEVQVALGRLAADWRAPLGHALARSEGLQRIGPTLRALRRAVADAYLDQVSRIYRGVNTEACRAAFAQLPADEPHWLEMVVTVEPLGTYPLGRLRRFCLDSRTLARAERRLAGVAADAPTRAAVAALWDADADARWGRPQRLNVLGRWRPDGTPAGATRELALGVQRSVAELAAAGLEPAERCHVARLLLSRRNPHARPTLRWVVDDGPIDCRALRPTAHAGRGPGTPQLAHAHHARSKGPLAPHRRS